MVKTSGLKISVGILLLALLQSCSNKAEPANATELWPEIEPFKSGYLKVSEIHEIYYEMCGNPEGIPVFVIHGGPGTGCVPYYRRFFDPEKYLIVLHDQRGSGKSKPKRELRENTTEYLIEDIELLRKQLDIKKMVLFGGSWGSTLSLAYAEKYPENIIAMVLRGIFLPTHEYESDYYKRLAAYFPEVAYSCKQSLPDSINELNPSIIFQLFSLKDEAERKKYIKIITRLESKASALNISDEVIDEYLNDDKGYEDLVSNLLIGYYYISNNCFLEKGQLINNANKIPEIPVTIIHGRYDMLCPPIYAFELSRALSGSKLIIIEEAGHSMEEKPIESELVNTMKDLASHLE